MSKPKVKLHHYLATVIVSFITQSEVDDGGGHGGKKMVDNPPRSKHMNVTITNTKKIMTLPIMNNARAAMCQRLNAELGVDDKDIIDFTYLNLVYLGLMTEGEFQGEASIPEITKPNPFH